MKISNITNFTFFGCFSPECVRIVDILPYSSKGSSFFNSIVNYKNFKAFRIRTYCFIILPLQISLFLILSCVIHNSFAVLLRYLATWRFSPLYYFIDLSCTGMTLEPVWIWILSCKYRFTLRIINLNCSAAKILLTPKLGSWEIWMIVDLHSK